MLQKGKISVVVPIYNVEKYIHRCIDSILNQTYSNIEIILVNDGSPDDCGRIAESYQKRDSRVQVVHKNNGGLSDARNHGMKRVTGEFTMFVDSDDWIEQDMIRVLVKNSYEHKADIVQADFYYAYDDELFIDKRHYKGNEQPIHLDNQTLMYELVKNEQVKSFAWGKLYKTEIIKDISFVKGLLFEDVFWAHQVMHRVNAYLILQEPLYYYYQREDSIVSTYSLKNLDMIRGLKERHHFIEKFYTELTGESYKHILKSSLIHYNLLVRNRTIDKDGTHRRDIKTYIKKNYGKLKDAVKDDKELQKQLYLFSLHPSINIAFLGVKKGLRGMKILSQPIGLERVNI